MRLLSANKGAYQLDCVQPLYELNVVIAFLVQAAANVSVFEHYALGIFQHDFIIKC